MRLKTFAFEVKVDFGLNYTFPGGWLEKMKIEQSSASAGLKLAELGKKHRNSLTEEQNGIF